MIDISTYFDLTPIQQLEVLQKAMPKKHSGHKGDASRGGKLMQKKVMDKRGHEVTKWVARNGASADEQKGEKEPSQYSHKASKSEEPLPLAERENQVPLKLWTAKAKDLEDDEVIGAYKKAKNKNVKIVLAHEWTRRQHIEHNNFIAFDKLPEIMHNKCLSKITSTYTKNSFDGISALNNMDALDREKGNFTTEEADLINNAFATENGRLNTNVVMWKALDPIVHASLNKELFSAKIGSRIFAQQPIIAHGELVDNYVNKIVQDKQIRLKIYGLKGDEALLFSKERKAFMLPTNTQLYVLDRVKNTLSIKIKK